MIKTKRLKIGHQVYALKNDIKRMRSLNYLGLCEKDQACISYDGNQVGATVADSVLHETLHAIVHNYIFQIDNCHEEEIVTQMTHGLIQVMRDNPKFFDELKSLL